jgi:hypothetical protein
MLEKSLLRRLNVRDDDPVGREVTAARKRVLQAGVTSFAGDGSSAAEFVRQAFTARLGDERSDAGAQDNAHREIYGLALDAARSALHVRRAADEIGDDAFHQLEEELDRLGGWQISHRFRPGVSGACRKRPCLPVRSRATSPKVVRKVVGVTPTEFLSAL